MKGHPRAADHSQTARAIDRLGRIKAVLSRDKLVQNRDLLALIVPDISGETNMQIVRTRAQQVFDAINAVANASEFGDRAKWELDVLLAASSSKNVTERLGAHETDGFNASVTYFADRSALLKRFADALDMALRPAGAALPELTTDQTEFVFDLFMNAGVLLEWARTERRIRSVLLHSEAGSDLAAWHRDWSRRVDLPWAFIAFVRLTSMRDATFYRYWLRKFNRTAPGQAIASFWLSTISYQDDDLWSAKELWDQPGNPIVRWRQLIEEESPEPVWRYLKKFVEQFPTSTEQMRCRPPATGPLYDDEDSDPIPLLEATYDGLAPYFPEFYEQEPQRRELLDRTVRSRLEWSRQTGTRAQTKTVSDEVLRAVQSTLDEGWVLWDAVAPQWSEPLHRPNSGLFFR